MLTYLVFAVVMLPSSEVLAVAHMGTTKKSCSRSFTHTSPREEYQPTTFMEAWKCSMSYWGILVTPEFYTVTMKKDSGLALPCSSKYLCN